MAGKKIGLVLALDGEKEFKSAIKAVKEEVKLYGDSIKNLDTAFANNKNSAEALSKKHEALAKQQEAYKKQVDAAKNGLDNAKKQYQDQASALEKLNKKLDEAEKELKQMADAGDTSSDAYKKQKAEVDKLSTAVSKQTTNVNNAQSRVNAWTREVNNSESALNNCDAELHKNEQYLKEASSAADGCATSIDKFGNEASEAEQDTEKLNISLKDMVKNKLVDLGGDILRDLGRKAMEAAKFVIDVGSSFEAQMSKVQALSGATNSEMTKLTAVAAEMGRTTKFTATEAGEGLEYMALAGWKTEDMIAGLPGIMNLAAASGADLGTTSDIVTDALTAFGASAGDAGRLADVMAASSTNANTTVELMGETFKYVAPVAGALGYSMEDTSEAIGLMANAGIKGSQAGTSLRSIITRLSTDAGASSKSLGALGTLTEKLGVEFFNADGTARNLNDVLTDARAVWGGLTEEEQINYANTIAGKNAMSGWLALMNASPTDVGKLETALANCDGAAAAMAATMNDNLNGKITLMNSALEGLGVALYGYISGPLQNIVTGVTDIINGITNAITPQKTELESFIESIGKSNEAVEKSIASAEATVANAKSEVAGLESAKTFLEGVLDNCAQFNETDLSSVATKIELDLNVAETALSDVDKAAGDAVEGMNAVNDVKYDGSNLNEDAIKTPLENIDTAAGDAKESIEDVDNTALDGSKMNESSVTTPLETIETKADEAKESVEGVDDTVMNGSGMNESSVTTPLETIKTDADEAKKSVEEVDDVKLSGENVNESAITTPLESIKTKADEAGTAISGVGDSTISTSNVENGTNAIVTDMGEAALAAESATEAIKKPGNIKPTSISSKVKTATESIVEAEEGVKTGAEEANTAISNIGSNTEYIIYATTALGYLKDEQKNVVVVTDEFTKSKITNMVNALGGSVKELASAWNAETGELTASKEQLDEWFNTAKEIAMNNALQKAMQELYTAWGEAARDAALANSAVNEALREFNTEAGTSFTNWQEAIDYANEAESGWIESSVALNDAVDAQIACNETLDKAQEALDTTGKALEQYTSTEEKAKSATEELKDATEEGADADSQAIDKKELLYNAFSELVDITGDAEEATSALTDKQKESVQAFQEMADATINDLVEMADQMGMSAGEFADWCQAQVDYIDELKKDYASLAESVTNALKSYVNDLDLADEEGNKSLSNLINNMESKLDDIRTWGDNMQTLAGLIGNGFSQELYDSIVEQGYEKSAETVQLLVDSIDKETGQFNEEGQRAADVLLQGLTEPEIIAKGVADQTQIGKDYAAAVAAGFTGSEEEYKQSVLDLVNSGAEAAKSSASGYKEGGAAGGESLAEGVSEQESAVTSASKAVVDAGISTATTASDMFKTVGSIAMLALSAGMNQQKDSVTDRAQKIVEEASSLASTTGETKFTESGKKAIESYANAIKSNAPSTATEQAKTAATKAGEQAKITSDDKFKTAGEAAIKAYASAISNNKHLSTAQALSAATDAGEATDKRQYMFTGAGQSAVKAFASGISNTKHLSTAQALATATDAGSAVDKRQYMFTGAGSAAVKAFASGISNNKHLSTAQALSAGTDAGSAIDKARYMFSGAGSAAASSYASGISGGAGSASNAAANAASNAAYSARGYYSSFYYAGSYVIDGFASGINAYSYKAAYAAANAAAQALASAKARIGVASPSKEFIKVGKFVDEGFALGIEKNQKLIEDAAAKASQATLDAAKNMDIASRIDIVGADKLNEMTAINAEASEGARAMQQLTNGLKVMANLAESLTNPQAPNITVMIGNREFKGYIINTAIEGMGQKQKSLMRGVGA